MQVILFFDVDDFDGYEFVGFVVFAFVDVGAVAEADLVWECVGEVLYFFKGDHSVHGAVAFGGDVVYGEAYFVLFVHAGRLLL